MAHQLWSEDDGASATVKPSGPDGHIALVGHPSQYQRSATAGRTARVVADVGTARIERKTPASSETLFHSWPVRPASIELT